MKETVRETIIIGGRWETKKRVDRVLKKKNVRLTNNDWWWLRQNMIRIHLEMTQAHNLVGRVEILIIKFQWFENGLQRLWVVVTFDHYLLFN